ncbi:helix-turn-helix domain-containing protein [Terrihabitans sp. B22-R8]|uniref:helix-turn-helix domain-containing protein n=1 Tax=Terrihabitans sp. B22-R8 TaxID=3425128 RepID=UPI00403C5AAD
MSELSGAEERHIADRLREELARRRVSRQALADMAKVSLSTLEKALAGSRPFTLATIVRLEEALGTKLRGSAPPNHPDQAPDEMGAYSRAAIRWIEQDYVTLRASFTTRGAIFAYRTRICWDDIAGHLRFAESERLDTAFTQTGHVSMPNLSGHIYLVTNEAGQHRLITLGRPTRDRRMFGLLSTLQAGSGSQLVPIATPLAFVPVEQMADLTLGLIAQDAPAFSVCKAILDTALSDDFCRLRSA